MLSILTDTLPKPVLAGAALWATVSYFVIGPEAGSRIARADHVSVCTANFEMMAAKIGEERLRALPVPSLDPMQELAVDQVRRLQNNPFMNHLRGMSGGMADIFGIDQAANAALAQMDHAKRTARQAYDAARSRIKAETNAQVAGAGDVCSCVADAAIAQTRTDWAIYAGTLTLYEPAPVVNFSQTMAKVHGAGACAGKAGA